jgi:hypothetical protein
VFEVRDRGHAPCQHVEQMLADRLLALDAQIADLEALRQTVAQLHDTTSTADPDQCTAEQVCRYL